MQTAAILYTAYITPDGKQAAQESVAAALGPRVSEGAQVAKGLSAYLQSIIRMDQRIK